MLQPRLFLIFFFASFFTIGLTAQNIEEELVLRKSFEEYFKTVIDMDIEKTLDYIYPKLFDKVPRDQMAMALEMAYDNPEMSIAMDDSTIGQIDPFFVLDDIRYTQVNYSFRMHLQFKTTDEEELKDMGDFMLTTFQQQYGEDNVAWNEAEKTISVLLDNTMLAIQDPAYGEGWKFLEKKENLFPMLKEILPKKAFKHLTRA